MSAREFFILMAMCVVWGFHYVVLKTGVGAIPPMLYAALRMTLVAALMAPFLRWRPGRMAPVLVAGLCMGAINYAFLFSGVKLATASAAAIAIQLYVPFATILSIVFLKEQVGWRRTLGIALAFAGVAIVALTREQSVEAKIGVGVALVAGCALTEAVGAILVKRIEGFRPHHLLAWFALIGALCLWPATLVLEPDGLPTLAEADWRIAAGAVAYSAIAASVVGHTAYYWLLQRLPVSLVASSTLLTTLLGVVFSILFLGERVSAPFVLGALTTLAGVGIVLVRTAVRSAGAGAAAPPPPAAAPPILAEKR